jgi:hypothetical protein
MLALPNLQRACICASVLLLVVRGVCGVENLKNDTALATAPRYWVAAVQTQIEATEADLGVFNKVATKLEGLGPEPSLNQVRTREEFEAFVRYRRAADQIEHELFIAERSLSRNIYDLCKMTGHCAPILAHAHGELAKHGGDICKDYRAWLKQNEHIDLEQVVRGELFVNIDAVKSEYCYLALDVISTQICFDSPPKLTVSHGSPYDLPLSSASRAKAHQSMKDWYASNKDKLVWNAKSSIFVNTAGTPFNCPDFKLVPAWADDSRNIDKAQSH